MTIWPDVRGEAIFKNTLGLQATGNSEEMGAVLGQKLNPDILMMQRADWDREDASAL